MSDNMTKLKFPVHVPLPSIGVKNEEISSEQFSIISPISKIETKWKVVCNLKDRDKPEVFIGLKLLSNNVDFDITVMFALEKIWEIPGKELEPKQVFFSKNEWKADIDLLGYAEFVTHDKLYENKDSYYPEGVLKFKINILAHSVDIGCCGNEVKILEIYENLLETAKHADVTIFTANGELKAHSLILSTRSDIFNKHFETSKEFDATEFSSEVIKKILKFIYTNKIDDIKMMKGDEFVQVCNAATKCGVSDLMKSCLWNIYEDLEEQNPIEFASFIAQCDCVSDELLASSALIITENFKTSVKDAKWIDLKKEIKVKILEVANHHVSSITRKLVNESDANRSSRKRSLSVSSRGDENVVLIHDHEPYTKPKNPQIAELSRSQEKSKTGGSPKRRPSTSGQVRNENVAPNHEPSTPKQKPKNPRMSVLMESQETPKTSDPPGTPKTQTPLKKTKAGKASAITVIRTTRQTVTDPQKDNEQVKIKKEKPDEDASSGTQDLSTVEAVNKWFNS